MDGSLQLLERQAWQDRGSHAVSRFVTGLRRSGDVARVARGVLALVLVALRRRGAAVDEEVFVRCGRAPAALVHDLESACEVAAALAPTTVDATFLRGADQADLAGAFLDGARALHRPPCCEVCDGAPLFMHPDGSIRCAHASRRLVPGGPHWRACGSFASLDDLVGRDGQLGDLVRVGGGAAAWVPEQGWVVCAPKAWQRMWSRACTDAARRRLLPRDRSFARAHGRRRRQLRRDLENQVPPPLRGRPDVRLLASVPLGKACSLMATALTDHFEVELVRDRGRAAWWSALVAEDVGCGKTMAIAEVLADLLATSRSAGWAHAGSRSSTRQPWPEPRHAGLPALGAGQRRLRSTREPRAHSVQPGSTGSNRGASAAKRGSPRSSASASRNRAHRRAQRG